MGGSTNWKFFGIVMAYVAVTYLLAWQFHFTVKQVSPHHFWMFISLCVFSIGILFIWCLYKDRPDRPFHYIPVWAKHYKTSERARAAVPILILTALLLSTFGSLKSAIPVMNPFALDPFLADLDESIHGVAAWKVIHPIVGYPIITYLLNIAYNFWFVAFYASVLIAAGWIERPDLRQRYLVSFLLCWILIGSLAAVFSSSVGPCFYDDFYNSRRFEPLMTYLAETNTQYELNVLKVQAWLLQVQAQGTPGIGKGISAMPSVHVSIAVLIAIFGWNVSRGWGIATTLYAVLIFVGSIHLGYHYAVDGYVSLIATPLVWAVAGWKPKLIWRPKGVAVEA